MSEFKKPQTFYDTRQLTFEEKKSLLVEAHTLAYTQYVERLDCSKSFSRQRTDMTFEDVMRLFNKSCHFVVIYRAPIAGYLEYVEVGFSTIDNPAYYLFMYMTPENGEKLISKYNLE